MGRGGNWAHVGVGGWKTSRGKWGGGDERDSPIQWQHCVSLQNVSKLILSHFPLAQSIFPSFNPPPLSLSYRPFSLILPLSPSSQTLCCPILPTFTLQTLNCSPHQFSFPPHPIFSLSHQAERPHYPWPKIFPFLSSLLPPTLWGDTCDPPATCSVLFPSANHLTVTINDVNILP